MTIIQNALLIKKYRLQFRKVMLLFMALFSLVQSWAQRVDSTPDLYLLIGQSNMAGRGEITEEYKLEGSPNVLMLNKQNNWVQATHPLHFDKSVAGVGPGLSFGMAMYDKKNGHKIGLIPCAVGGTSIDSWKPGGYDNATNTHPYDDAVIRLTTAMQSGKIKGVIWLQGESDSDSTKATSYLDKLTELISRIRTIANNPSLPFVAGELGQFKKQYQNINTVLAQLPARVPNTLVAGSTGLSDKGDQTHFDSRSADEYGKRFAKKMKRLIKK